MAVARQVDASIRHHEAIVAALAEGDVAEVAERLQRHWRFGLDQVLVALHPLHRPST